MATTHTWTGAVNNDAANPGNWTGGAPQPGDILTDTISGSTIDITDDALAGNQLRIVRPPSPDGLGTTRNVTLDLSDNAQANLSLDSALKIVANLSGNDTLEASLSGFGVLVAPSDLTVNLAEHTNLHGSFQVDGPGARLTISGGEDTRYVHNATDRIGGTGVIDTKVVGSGAFILTPAYVHMAGPAPSHLEFGGFVAAEQTVDITGPPAFMVGSFSTLQVDDPRQFHAMVDLHDSSLTDLVGLAQADSWSYANDLLSIKAASGMVLDTLHIVSDASSTGSVHGLSVSKTAAGDVLVSPGTDFHGLLALPTS